MQDNVQDILDTGIKAQHELSLVEDRIGQFKKEIMEAFAACKPGQDQERRNLGQALQISEKVLEYLKLDINQAKHAKNKIEEIQRVGHTSILDRIMP